MRLTSICLASASSLRLSGLPARRTVLLHAVKTDTASTTKKVEPPISPDEMSAASNNILPTGLSARTLQDLSLSLSLSAALLPYATGARHLSDEHSADMPAHLLSAESDYHRECELIGCADFGRIDGNWEIAYAASESSSWLAFGIPKPPKAAPALLLEDGKIAIANNGVRLHATLTQPEDVAGTFEAVPEGTVRGTIDAVELGTVTLSGETLDSSAALLDLHKVTPLLSARITLEPFHVSRGSETSGEHPLAAASTLTGEPSTADTMAARLTVGSNEALVVLRSVAPVAQPTKGVAPPAVPVTPAPRKRSPEPVKSEAFGSSLKPKMGKDGFYRRVGDDRKRKTLMGAQIGGYDSPMQVIEEEGVNVLLAVSAVGMLSLFTSGPGRLWMWQSLMAASLIEHMTHGSNLLA